METKQNETKQVEQKKGKPAKRKWKNPFTSNRFKRGGMSTLLSVVFIAIVVAVNVGVTALTDRFPSLDIDMTAQGLNTLSDQAMEIAKSVDKDTTITLIGTEEAMIPTPFTAPIPLTASSPARSPTWPGAWRRPTPTSPWSLWTRTPTPSSSATMPTTT